jgi:hypothetical protein
MHIIINTFRDLCQFARRGALVAQKPQSCVQYNRADSGQGLLSFGAAREFFLPSPPVKLIKMKKKYAQPRERKKEGREKNYRGNNSVYLLGTFPFVATLRCNSTQRICCRRVGRDFGQKLRGESSLWKNL